MASGSSAIFSTLTLSPPSEGIPQAAHPNVPRASPVQILTPKMQAKQRHSLLETDLFQDRRHVAPQERKGTAAGRVLREPRPRRAAVVSPLRPCLACFSFCPCPVFSSSKGAFRGWVRPEGPRAGVSPPCLLSVEGSPFEAKLLGHAFVYATKSNGGLLELTPHSLQRLRMTQP
jgi:hypothetical protein